MLQNAGQTIEALHTPNSKNVTELFLCTIDHPGITTCWGRQKMGHKKAADTLDEWLDIRHSIAHGAQEGRLIKADVLRFRSFLDITVRNTEKELSKHLSAIVGAKPW